MNAAKVISVSAILALSGTVAQGDILGGVGGAASGVGETVSGISNGSVGVQSRASASASIPNVATVEVCAGVSVGSSTEGCQGGRPTALHALAASGKNPARLIQTIKGSRVVGADGRRVGTVTDVKFNGQTFVYIDVALSRQKKVRLVNAISGIEGGSVNIRASRRVIERSAKHAFTKLVMKCDSSEEAAQFAWNSCDRI